VLPVGIVADIFKSLHRIKVQVYPLLFCLDNHLKCDFKADERLQTAVNREVMVSPAQLAFPWSVAL